MLCLRFTDHGCGMGEEALRHVYDKFYQEDPSRSVPGIGLGMSLAKKIVELHSGEILLSSRKGEGTEAEVVLPACEKSWRGQGESPS